MKSSSEKESALCRFKRAYLLIRYFALFLLVFKTLFTIYAECLMLYSASLRTGPSNALPRPHHQTALGSSHSP